jgi:hypothetical protein
MKWEKIGRIFDPRAFRQLDEFVGYAKSPQALVFDDFIRVYFSAAKKTESGKVASHVRYADLDTSLSRVLAVADAPVIPLGKLGCFDEHGIFPMNVLWAGEKIYAYTTGWSRRKSVSVETAIGFATSTNGGRTFDKCGDGPILAASLREPFLVCDAFVRIFGGRFHMWYIYGTQWTRFDGEGDPERTYVIGHAVSCDGLEWKSEGKSIIEQLSPGECQALPTVLELDGRFHMFFCYRQTFGFRQDSKNGYRLGYAWSKDLKTWTRDDAQMGIDMTPGDWDSDMMCYPHVFAAKGDVFLLYNGNNFGRDGFGAARLRSVS